MNTKLVLLFSLRRCLPALGLLLTGAQIVTADPGIISATVDQKGPVRIGEEIAVVVRLEGYTDATEIDGFNLTVNYDPALFEIVGGSVDLGDAAGPDQQWLSKARQEAAAAGYRL